MSMPWVKAGARRGLRLGPEEKAMACRRGGSKGLIPLVGKRFGRLLVLSRAGLKTPPRWLCQCDCGNRKTVPGASLRNGNTRSCGCLRRRP